MDSGAIYPVYVVVKYAAYAGWCYYGLRILRQKSSIQSAAGFGLLRLFLGVGFGIGVFFLGGILHLEVPSHPVTMYLAIYAPVRYVEWSILVLLLLSGNGAKRRYSDLRSQLWILGGITVSHLADLPIILFTYEGAKGFLPVGRFLC
jgi:hypothetical protein